MISQTHTARTTIAVTGPRASQDCDLVRSYFGSNGGPLRAEGVEYAQALQLASNKWSVLPSNAVAAPPIEGDLGALLAKQRRQHERWLDMLHRAIELFDRLGAGYALMKALGSPNSLMSDVDFLVPEPNDLARVTQALEADGFSLYRFRLLAHPLKVMAILGGQSPQAPPCVDLYPDAMWVRRHVLDGPGVIARRRVDVVRGVELYEPSYEDDLYLVATHAFAHGAITLAELDHGLRLTAHEDFDWDRLRARAEAFGCVDSLYVYLRLLAEVCRHAGFGKPVPAAFLRRLAADPAARAPRQWLDQVEGQLEFPLHMPLWLCTVRSALYHLPAVSRRIRPGELVMDLAAHGMAVGAHLLKRD